MVNRDHHFEGGNCIFCGANFFTLGIGPCVSVVNETKPSVYDDSVWAAVRERIRE